MVDVASKQLAQDIPIACTLSEAERTQRGDEIAQTLFSGCLETHELPDGYALRFPGDDPWPARLYDFVVRERACCAFFSFALIFEQQQGPIWLHLRGPTGTKEFVWQLLVPVGGSSVPR
jgi:hypothetical protein